MRRILSLTCVLFLFFCIDREAIAALSFLPENGLVLDDKGDQDITNDQFWIADLSLLTNMTYTEQKESIESWNEESSQFYNAQLTPWHMATDLEMELFRSFHVSEIFSAFIPSYVSVDESGSQKQYTGRSDVMRPNQSGHMLYSIAAYFGLDGGYSALTYWGPTIPDDDIYHGAWVTASYSAIPIPSAIWLLGSAFIGLVGFRRKIKK